MKNVSIIGGGPAGMLAAVMLARAGIEVDLYEKNEKLGKKLFITGKGRCNFTNASEPEELLDHVVTNRRFLYSAFWGYTSSQVIELFEDLGVRTKVERGKRAFPSSDHSSDIIRALEGECRSRGVRIHLGSEVMDLILEPLSDREAARQEKFRVRGLVLAGGRKKYADALILATGGLSYPVTGSTGDGYRFAAGAGHEIRKCRPALVPLETEEAFIPALQGLALKNVCLTIGSGKKKFSDFGELLFTHFGISGPLALSASSFIGAALENGPLPAEIDLKPALSPEELDQRLLREFEAARNKEFKNVVPSLFPARLRPVMVERSGIPETRPVRDISREERLDFVRLIKHFDFTIRGTRGYREAIITQGGIHVGEINPSTMESRLARGLYAIGEVLDLDALTGGFNLQIAWSTAYAAAGAIAKQEQKG